MGKTVLAFAASNSSQSINAHLASYAAKLLSDAEADSLNIHDFEMPIYRHDREEAEGIPQLAHDFLARLAAADGLIIAFAEHNGTYSAAFKNLFDWCSRIGREVYQNKPILLLSTSPGPGGAARVLEVAKTATPHFGGNIAAALSLPEFDKNFDSAAGKMSNAQWDEKLQQAVAQLEAAL